MTLRVEFGTLVVVAVEIINVANRTVLILAMPQCQLTSGECLCC